MILYIVIIYYTINMVLYYTIYNMILFLFRLNKDSLIGNGFYAYLDWIKISWVIGRSESTYQTFISCFVLLRKDIKLLRYYQIKSNLFSNKKNRTNDSTVLYRFI